MQKYKFKADWTMYLIFFIMASIFSVPLIMVFIKDPNEFLALIIPVVVYSFLYFWISSFKIEIKEGKIFYNSLLNRKEETINNIKKLEINVGTNSQGPNGRRSGFYNLDVISDNQVISINIKPFTKIGLITFIKKISEMNRNIQLDKFSTNLKNSNFKPLVNKGISKIWQIALVIIFFGIIKVVFELLSKQ